MKALGFKLDGPIPADTVFAFENYKKFDAVIAMYHDQGLAPFKALAFGEAVNITLGLPIVRTSVDHGTAFDKAATGMARSTSLEAAIKTRLKSRKIKNDKKVIIQKKFGQNFLKDKSVIDKIINSINCKDKQLSLEIGPGLGVLTKKLFDFSAQVIAIEIDHHLVEILEKI